jgi:hypothetical protein
MKIKDVLAFIVYVTLSNILAFVSNFTITTQTTTTQIPALARAPVGKAKIFHATRLRNFYMYTFPVTDLLSCYQLCLNDYANGCVAVSITFTQIPFQNYCFQYKSGHGHVSHSKSISILLGGTPTIIAEPANALTALGENAQILNKTRLSNDYVYIYPVVDALACYQLCVNEYADECVAVTMTLTESPFQSVCYLYKKGYSSGPASQWTSIVKTDSSPKLITTPTTTLTLPGEIAQVFEGTRLRGNYYRLAYPVKSISACFQLCFNIALFSIEPINVRL